MPDSKSFDGPDRVETPGAAALYIANLSHELAQIASRHGLDALSYILDMARLEADQIAKDSGQANGGS